MPEWKVYLKIVGVRIQSALSILSDHSTATIFNSPRLLPSNPQWKKPLARPLSARFSPVSVPDRRR